jgi:hypothetical protein
LGVVISLLLRRGVAPAPGAVDFLEPNESNSSIIQHLESAEAEEMASRGIAQQFPQAMKGVIVHATGDCAVPLLSDSGRAVVLRAEVKRQSFV